jgi:hypothetical protein
MHEELVLNSISKQAKYAAVIYTPTSGYEVAEYQDDFFNNLFKDKNILYKNARYLIEAYEVNNGEILCKIDHQAGIEQQSEKLYFEQYGFKNLKERSEAWQKLPEEERGAFIDFPPNQKNMKEKLEANLKQEAILVDEGSIDKTKLNPKNWIQITKGITLSEDFIRECQDRADWGDVFRRQKLSEDFIREFKDKVGWNVIVQKQTLSDDFISDFQEHLPWDYISCYQKLSKDSIIKFQNKLDWDYISSRQDLSENFIKEFQNKVNWSCISRGQKLSENFIREFKNRVNWKCISGYQTLSEDFIKEFKDRVDWEVIFEKQVLSKKFIDEFKNYSPTAKLDFDTIFEKLKNVHKDFKFDTIFTTDEKGFKKMLGYFADEIRGNDGEWIFNFLSIIGFIAPGYFIVDRGDTGLYLSLGDFEIHDNEHEEETYDEFYLGDTDDLMNTPLASGEVCNPDTDEYGIIHCGKLLEEIGIVQSGFLD